MARTATINTIPAHKLRGDVEFLGNLTQHDPVVAMRVIQKYRPKGMLSFLSAFNVSNGVGLKGKDRRTAMQTGGVTTSAAEKMVEMKIGSQNRLMAKTTVINNITPPTFIRDRSALPSTMKAGQTETITLSDSWIDADGLLHASDGLHVFLATQKTKIYPDGSGKYDIQLVHDDPNYTIDTASILRVDAPLNYLGNAKGELSTTGQGGRAHGSYDIYSGTQVQRGQVAFSGHFLSDSAANCILYSDFDETTGKPRNAVFPMSQAMMELHLDTWTQQLLWGKSNFDVKNQRFLNASPLGPKADRPTTDGFMTLMDSTIHNYHYNPNDLPSVNRQRIKEAISTARRYYEEKNVTLVAFTGNGGEEVLQEIFLEENRALGIQVHVTPEAGVLQQAGLVVGSLKTTAGTIYPYNYSSALRRGTQYDQTSKGGISYDARSFDIYLVPMYVNPDGRANLRVNFISNTVNGLGTVNRGLVMGIQRGMTGLFGGLPKLQAGIEESNIFTDSNQISSPVDGEQAHVLTHWATMMDDPDGIIKLTAVAPKFSL